MTRRPLTASPTAALLALVAFCSAAVPAIAQESVLDPYPPQPPPGPVLPVAPPPRVPPLLPVAPPPSVPPPLPIAPPPAMPIDPYGPSYAPPPHPPNLLPPPAWGQRYGCGVPGCEGAQLAYTPRSPAGETEKRPRYGLMSAGISVLGGLWVISMSSGVLAQHYELAIPIVGPFLTASDVGRSVDPWDGRNLLVGLLAMDGIFQAAGLIMAIAGGASRVTVQKRRPTAPTIYPSGAGFYGRF